MIDYAIATQIKDNILFVDVNGKLLRLDKEAISNLIWKLLKAEKHLEGTSFIGDDMTKLQNKHVK